MIILLRLAKDFQSSNHIKSLTAVKVVEQTYHQWKHTQTLTAPNENVPQIHKTM